MEPLTTNSSDRTHIDELELEQIPPSQRAQTLQPETATSGRTRVRINSVAAEIPPPQQHEERPSIGRISEAESLEAANVDDQTVAAAEQLLKAHNANGTYENYTTDSPDPFAGDDSDEYAFTGNTQGGVFYQLLQAYKNPVPAY